MVVVTIGLAGRVLLVVDALFRHEGRRSQLAACADPRSSRRRCSAPAARRLPGVAGLLRRAPAVVADRPQAPATSIALADHRGRTRRRDRCWCCWCRCWPRARATLSAGAARIPGPRDVWSGARNAPAAPAALMTTGGRADAATTIWRGGGRRARSARCAVIPPDPEATGRYLATSAVYGWSGQARTLSMRGMLVAPGLQETKNEPPLWRVAALRALPRLDVGMERTSARPPPAASSPACSPRRPRIAVALVYLGSSRRLSPAAARLADGRGAGIREPRPTIAQPGRRRGPARRVRRARRFLEPRRSATRGS